MDPRGETGVRELEGGLFNPERHSASSVCWGDRVEEDINVCIHKFYIYGFCTRGLSVLCCFT